MALTYSAPAVSLTLNIIESYDIDPAPLLENLGINPKLIADPNARFDYSKIDQLWFDAAAIANDPAFGLRAAKYWHPSQMGALGYAWLTSSSLHTALQRLVQYIGILTEGAILKLDETADEYSLQLSYKAVSQQQATRTDSFMAMLLTMCRANCGENFHPNSVSLTHLEPADSAEFLTLFKCPVYFSAKENRFNVSKEIADRRLLSANPQLSLINDQIITEAIAKLEKDNTIALVKTEILKQLPYGNVTDASIAKALNIAQRSLQRKLQNEKTTLRSIINEMREELAKKYLQNSNMNLLDIAFNLGFSEYSSFSRAFKQWTGQTPSAYKKY